jgi:DNA-binding protein Fis
MSDPDSQRNVPKRQIARLIGTSEFPIWVLSESDQLVFGNDAFIALLDSLDSAHPITTHPINPEKNKSPSNDLPATSLFDQMLGMECKLDSVCQSTLQTILARWLAVPANTPRNQSRIVLDRLPEVFKTIASESMIEASNIRTLVPLGTGAEACFMCILKPDCGEVTKQFDPTFRTRIELPALSILSSEPNLDTWWYLHGNTPKTATLRAQFQLAASGNHPIHLVAPTGAPTTELADWILHQRFLKLQSSATSSATLSATPSATPSSASPSTLTSKRRETPIIIECQWLDKDLLTSVFEWIDDLRRQDRQPEVIIHRVDTLAPELREPLATIAKKQQWKAIITSTSLAKSSNTQQNPIPTNSPSNIWNNWVAQFEVQTIELIPLSKRTEEIESLLLAWMRQHPEFQWDQSYLDALLAYAWPSDANEFEQALSESITHCRQEYDSQQQNSSDSAQKNSLVLQERHLPISLRTFPSHIERPTIDEPIDLDQALEAFEREWIEHALAQYPRNNSAAAKALGISRARLLRRMQQWGLSSPQSPASNDDPVIFEELS